MTVRENMIPSAMVPGLVTIRGLKGDHKGKTQNVYPVDAKELIASGDYELVENGAVEVARLAATPLRSGLASGIPPEHLVAEISGIEGRVIVAENEAERDKVREAGDNADSVPANKGTTAKTASAADSEKASESAHQPKTQAEKDAAEKARSGGAGSQGAADKK